MVPGTDLSSADASTAQLIIVQIELRSAPRRLEKSTCLEA
jgi:hypothetical protein